MDYRLLMGNCCYGERKLPKYEVLLFIARKTETNKQRVEYVMLKIILKLFFYVKLYNKFNNFKAEPKKDFFNILTFCNVRTLFHVIPELFYRTVKANKYVVLIHQLLDIFISDRQPVVSYSVH